MARGNRAEAKAGGFDHTDEDRHIIKTALNNHVEELLKTAKKLNGLGHEPEATKLNLEATHITEKLVPDFDDQRSLALESGKDDGDDD